MTRTLSIFRANLAYSSKTSCSSGVTPLLKLDWVPRLDRAVALLFWWLEVVAVVSIFRYLIGVERLINQL